MTFAPVFPLPIPLLVPVVAWFVAQSAKVLLALARKDTAQASFLAPGGMPSAHSATVASLFTLAVLREGWNSTVVALTGVLVALVLYDALVVRAQSGKQARELNQIASTIYSGSESKQLREIVGHRPAEVLVGFALGVLIGMLCTPLPRL